MHEVEVFFPFLCLTISNKNLKKFYLFDENNYLDKVWAKYC
jgi:hypothetical protein